MTDDTKMQSAAEDRPSYAAYLLVILVAVGILGLPDLVQAHWQTIGPVYVRVVASAARLIRPDLAIATTGNWLLTSRVNISVWAPCVGTDGIRIFNWKKMRGVLPMFAYLGAVAVLAVASFARVLFMLWRPQDTHLGAWHIITLSTLALAATVFLRRSGQASAKV
jgi:hypothetical protein